MCASMKKSEIVKLVLKESLCLTTEIQVSDTISILEKHGMLPPEATVEEWVDCGDGQRHEVNTKHAWEPE
jgi:hypothetical protein